MPFIVFFVFVILWMISFKLFPNQTTIIKQKFDYIKPRTTFYSKGKVTVAVLFWLFLLFVGLVVAKDVQATIVILGLISLIYAVFVGIYIRDKCKVRQYKQDAIKVPGKIVGTREKTSSHYSYENGCYRVWRGKLIVEFENPYTHQKEEYVTKAEINCGPFWYLKSLDVTVYYKDADHIWVDDFKRIRKLTDSISYQTTGKVNGKDPGLLRQVIVPEEEKL